MAPKVQYVQLIREQMSKRQMCIVCWVSYDTLHPTQHESSINTYKVGLVLKTRRTAFRLELHFNESMLSNERLSHLFVATLRCNATDVTIHTLSMCAFLRGTKNIPLSETACQAKNVHGSEALHCLC